MTHIPTALHDPLTLISWENPWSGNIPTIMIGIILEHFLEEDWESQRRRFSTLFNITDPSFIMEIKTRNVGFGSNLLDGTQLKEETTVALHILNCLETTQLRIIHLGMASGPGLNESVESIIRGWNIPAANKQIQLITAGEAAGLFYFNFCKSLCLRRLCESVQYYNTMDFTNFGYFDSNHAARSDMASSSGPASC